MGKIYDAAGWVNWDYIMDQPESIISVVGARGTGKTYGLFKWMTEQREKFIYLRRLKSQLEECRKPDGNPFRKLNADKGWNILPVTQAGTVLFNKDGKDGETVAVGLADDDLIVGGGGIVGGDLEGHARGAGEGVTEHLGYVPLALHGGGGEDDAVGGEGGVGDEHGMVSFLRGFVQIGLR